MNSKKKYEKVIGTLWLKTPYPGEKPGEGAWHECTTPYERRLWAKHNQNNWLPTKNQGEKPEE